MSTILAKFKQNTIDDFVSSLDSPVRELRIEAQGAGYSNGDIIVFSGDGDRASGKVWTDDQGRVVHYSITDPGRYVVLPTATVESENGYGCVLTPVTDNDHFYLYAGRAKAFDLEPTRDPNHENDYDSFFFQHEHMMYGKKVSNTDVAFMTRTSEWSAGKVFVEYDDKDRELPQKDFYVLTSDNHVFKCIANGNQSPSMVEPSNTQISGIPATLSDGYRWKYMYSVTGQEKTKFKTGGFMPVKKNAEVVESAIDGGIFHIKIESGGDNYPTLTGQIKNTIGTNVIVLPDDASSVPNFYANCTITIFGTGNEIVNRRIISSGTQGVNRIVTLANSFNVNQAQGGFQFSIAPTLQVTGDGTGFEGFLHMNEDTRSISGVEVVDPGTGYHRAEAVAIAGTGFGAGSVLRPIISPRGGHGSDPFGEFYCKHMAVSGEFANNLGFPTDVTIRTFGILKNPLKPNGQPFTQHSFNQCVELETTKTGGSPYVPGETLTGVTSRAVGTIAVSTDDTTTITGYVGTFIPGEFAVGNISGAQYKINALNNSADLKVYSGDVIYLQNISPTPRNATSSEQVKLIIKL